MAWQSSPITDTSFEVERWRTALLKQPRSWSQWKGEVPIMAKKERTDEGVKNRRRAYKQNLTTVLHGVRCPHCHIVHDPIRLRVLNTYPNGNRRHQCSVCHMPFLTIVKKEQRQNVDG